MNPTCESRDISGHTAMPTTTNNNIIIKKEGSDNERQQQRRQRRRQQQHQQHHQQQQHRVRGWRNGSAAWGWGLSLPLLAGVLLHVASSAPVGVGLRGSPRYSLVPPMLRNETVLIQFNPPAIDRLKVHSRQRVYFNCTQIKRHSDRQASRPGAGVVAAAAAETPGTTSTTTSTTTPTTTTHSNPSTSEDDDNNSTTTTTANDTSSSGNTSRGGSSSDETNHAAINTTSHEGNINGGDNVTPASFTTTSTTATTTTTTASAAWGEAQTAQHGQASYWAMIFSSDDKIARPVRTSPSSSSSGGALQGYYTHHAPLQLLGGPGSNGVGGGRGPGAGGGRSSGYASAAGGGGGGGGGSAWSPPGGSYLLMEVWEGREHNFSIQALHVGRVTMSVAVVDKDAALLADNGHTPQHGNNVIQAVATSQFPVTTVRGQRTADLVFDSSAAAIAILITFGIGCCTDTDSVKKQLKFPVSLVIGFCCQFILMPILAFGLAMILPIEKDIRFGLLCTACVPGGGLGHIAVIIGDADIPLSLTMNLISVVVMLGTAPLWIFVLGQHFQTDPNAILSPRIIPIYNFEIWLASIFLAYAAGLVVNRFRPVVADVLLNWVIKPFLLLATILYITVGVYINMYVFELINEYAVLGAILLPLVGCVLGCTLAAVCRQKVAFVKTIALETSSLNCLIVLAALRFSLNQPDADLASMIPIWVMFTIPGLYVVLAILQRFYRTALHHWNMRRNAAGGSCSSVGGGGGKDSPTHNSSNKDYDVAAAIVSRPGLAALSAPLVVADGVDDDPAANNEKVTVL